MDELFGTAPPPGDGVPGNGSSSDRTGRAEVPAESSPGEESPHAEAAPIEDVYRGETVLLTGAGGSLGRALARRLTGLPLRHLVLADTSEHGLVQLRDALREEHGTVGAAEGDDAGVPDRSFVLGDLRTEAGRVRALEVDPTIVLHAAAYKHVPFLETRPRAAAENNLVATADLLRACRAARSVEQFVLVSTDKATCPTGIMGQTKAGAERLLRGLREAAAPGLTARTVRLCNVFGSRGSVVPRFCRAVRKRQPLRVTDPEMERRYLRPAAAAAAILHAGRHEAGIYVPRAGRSIRVDDLAERLLRWARPGADPEDWIRVVGRRPGERRRERLLAPSEQPPVPVGGGLLRAQDPRSMWENGSADSQCRPDRHWKECLCRVERVRRTCQEGEPRAVREALAQLAAREDVPNP